MEAGSMVEQPDGRSGPGDGGADELRARLHGMWAAVAGAWGEHAAYADERGAHAAERMLELTRPQPGERVLELACGPGALGRAAAERVAPGGEVVFSDVVADMTSIAVARATALGVRNVSARVLDIESIDEPDGSYDVVLCREGLMFAVDPARAVREMARVLRPGGRVALAVWGPRERNPWLGLVFDAVSAELGAPMPPPGVPGPFSLQDADRLAGLLVGAELDDVAVSELAVPLRAESFEAWWARTSALAGPLSKVLGALPDDAMRSLRARTREAISAYETPAGIELPGVALLASARAPSARAR